MSGLPTTTLLFWLLAALMTAGVALLAGNKLPPRIGLIVMLAIPAIALPVYLSLGRPELTAWRTTPQVPPFLAGAIADLQQGTHAHPEDPVGWVLLGDVDLKIQHYTDAEAAYRVALKLAPDDPHIAVALAETLVREGGGSITPEALGLFQTHTALPAARYYIALAKSQAADWDGALADWQALVKSAGPDDVWRQVTQDRIAEARRVLGLDRDH